MKLPSPRNHLDVALLIFSALRQVGIKGLRLQSSRVHRSASRYVQSNCGRYIRVSDHPRRIDYQNVDVDFVGYCIPKITLEATDWLEKNYGIKVQTIG